MIKKIDGIKYKVVSSGNGYTITKGKFGEYGYAEGFICDNGYVCNPSDFIPKSLLEELLLSKGHSVDGIDLVYSVIGFEHKK